MTDYTELVKALRYCEFGWSARTCDNCEYSKTDCQLLLSDAADAIEALQAEVEQCTLFKINTNLLNMREMSKEEADELLEYIRNSPVGPIEPMQIEQLPKRGEWVLTNDEIETIRIHMNAIKEQLCNQYRHREAEAYQSIVDKLAKMMEVQE